MTTQTVLPGKDTADGGDLYMSFELGDKQWQMSIGDSRRRVSRYTVGAGETAAVADCIVKAATRVRTGARARVQELDQFEGHCRGVDGGVLVHVGRAPAGSIGGAWLA